MTGQKGRSGLNAAVEGGMHKLAWAAASEAIWQWRVANMIPCVVVAHSMVNSFASTCEKTGTISCTT